MVDERKQKHTPEGGVRVFEAYVRVWALCTALRAFSRAGVELVYNEAVIAACAAAFALPASPAAVLVAFSVRVFALLASMPYIHGAEGRTTLERCREGAGRLRSTDACAARSSSHVNR